MRIAGVANGLHCKVSYYILFFIEVATRRVHITLSFRLLWITLSKLLPDWRKLAHLMQPDYPRLDTCKQDSPF